MMSKKALVLLIVLSQVISSFTSSNGGFGSRISSGGEVEPHYYPHLVAIFDGVNKDNFVCAGTIIRSIWVMTAAHCLEGLNSTIIWAGTDYISESLTENRQIREGIDFYVHEQFDSQSRANDIALIKLTSPLEYDKFVKPANLAHKVPTVGKKMTFVGWGDIGDFDSTTSLRRMRGDMISISVCREELDEKYQNINPKDLICMDPEEVKGEVLNLCEGDGGGPLHFKNEIVGVASILPAYTDDQVKYEEVVDCGSLLPSGFVSVSEYLVWLSNTMEANSAETLTKLTSKLILLIVTSLLLLLC